MITFEKQSISLGDNSYFSMFIGDRVLKQDIFRSNGDIPVYSANVSLPFGYLTESNIKDFTCDYILWGIDGEFNFNLIPAGTVFATTDHCGAIKIMNKELVPQYVLYALEIQGHILGFDRTLRPSMSNMGKVTIDIPLDSTGKFDIAEQKKVAEENYKIKKIQAKLKEESQKYKNAIIDILTTGNNIQLPELFNFPETNSGITKDFCQKHKGNIPVYGCSSSENAILGFIEDNIQGLHYYYNSLTWNRNGSVGHVFFRQDKFTTNEDHRVLSLKSKYKDSIYLPYIKYALENEILKKGFGFTNKLGKSKMEKIEIQIPVQQSDNKHFDYEKQKIIVNKINNIYRLKDTLINKLDYLSSLYVTI